MLLRLSVYALTTAGSRVKVCPVKLGQWEYVLRGGVRYNFNNCVGMSDMLGG